MLEELNKQLVEVKEKMRIRQKLQGDLIQIQQILSEERARLKQLEAELKKEGADVEKLEELSLTGLFYQILGGKEEQLKKERQKYLTVKLKYDECRDSVSALIEDQDELNKKISAYGAIDSQYRSILVAKEKLIAEAHDENTERLIRFSEELADVQSDVKELEEAISAGNAILEGLGSVINSLKSAKNWGTWDMLGSGVISTAIKHSRIDDARKSAHQAQQLLRRFQRELADVESNTELTIDIGSFTKFADYFFDGLIVDWVVQSRISRSLESTVQVQKAVRDIISSLKQSMMKAQKEANRISKERRTLLESA